MQNFMRNLIRYWQLIYTGQRIHVLGGSWVLELLVAWPLWRISFFLISLYVLGKRGGGTHPLYITTDNYWWSPKLTSPGALPCHAPFLLSGSFLSYPLHIFPISYLLLWSQHCQQELSPKPYLFAICTASLMWTSSALGVLVTQIQTPDLHLCTCMTV